MVFAIGLGSRLKEIEGLAQTGPLQNAPTAALINNKAVPILSHKPSISVPHLHTTNTKVY
jgi:hypothetical protein